jgi:Leucine-rich repeat (LRR) protein
MLANMKIPWPKRRWHQFSLRTLLVLVTLFAIPCSWLAVTIQQAKREEAAAAVILKSGATVEWDGNPSGPTWLRKVLGERFLGHVKVVNFLFAEVTDRTLEPLHDLSQLKELDLSFSSIADGVLVRLRGLPELRTLNFTDTDVTDADLEKLAALKQLEHLSLSGTSVTDVGLEELVGLNKLHTLSFSATKVPGTKLSGSEAQIMKQLKSIELRRARFTEAVKKLQQALPNCRIEFDDRIDGF